MSHAAMTDYWADMRLRFGDAVVDAHRHSIHHRREIGTSSICGCFFCLRQFAPAEIEDWTDDGATALCPHCGIDSVLGSASGYEISTPFLTQMCEAWFRGVTAAKPRAEDA